MDANPTRQRVHGDPERVVDLDGATLTVSDPTARWRYGITHGYSQSVRYCKRHGIFYTYADEHLPVQRPTG